MANLEHVHINNNEKKKKAAILYIHLVSTQPKVMDLSPFIKIGASNNCQDGYSTKIVSQAAAELKQST